MKTIVPLKLDVPEGTTGSICHGMVNKNGCARKVEHYGGHKRL